MEEKSGQEPEAETEETTEEYGVLACSSVCFLGVFLSLVIKLTFNV